MADKIAALRARGLTIGENVDIIDTYIDGCHGPLISIGDNVTITGARILAHDASTKKFIGYTKIGLVKIGSNVFIGNGAIVLPGTTIGDNVVIGAGTIVASDVPSNSVMIGNPARRLCTFDEYIDRNRERLRGANAYVSETMFCNRDKHLWDELRNELSKKKYGFDI